MPRSFRVFFLRCVCSGGVCRACCLAYQNQTAPLAMEGKGRRRGQVPPKPRTGKGGAPTPNMQGAAQGRASRAQCNPSATVTMLARRGCLFAHTRKGRAGVRSAKGKRRRREGRPKTVGVCGASPRSTLTRPQRPGPPAPLQPRPPPQIFNSLSHSPFQQNFGFAVDIFGFFLTPTNTLF